jgi:hypothetical protein
MSPARASIHKFFLPALLVYGAVLLLAQAAPAKRVHFARGRSSATVENSVLRGMRDRYLVGAKAGQMMTVRITSLERNAVFSIAKPDGEYVAHATPESDATYWSEKLPLSGDYVLEVGGTRGNAQYTLMLAIK